MTLSLFAEDLEKTLSPLTAEESARLAQAASRYGDDLHELSEQLYERLSDPDRHRFVLWFAKRWAHIDRIPKEEWEAYGQAVERIRAHPYPEEEFDGQRYKRLALAPQGYRGELLTYPWMLGIHDFLFNQYQNESFHIRPGDTIIDAGAFVGDTALLFHQVAEGDCHIHAFEVLEENLKLLRHNLDANGIAEDVRVCSLALSDQSGDSVHIKAPAVQGATSIFGNSDGIQVETITIDDYVKKTGIERVDLIKMDIEGAERLALAGALDTVRHHHPRLALCIYHLWDDALEIPRLIGASGVPYRYEFKWVELGHGWEAVLLCTPDSPDQP